MHKVTVSMWPNKTIEVDDRELADLKAQGLIVSEGAGKDQPSTSSAPAKTTRKEN
jgi:hypothetical protein